MNKNLFQPGLPQTAPALPSGPMVLPVACIFCGVTDRVQFTGTNTVQQQADPEDANSPAVDLRVINWFACPNGHRWGAMTWFALNQPAKTVMLEISADEAGTHHPINWEAVLAEKRRIAAMSQIVVPGGRRH